MLIRVKSKVVLECLKCHETTSLNVYHAPNNLELKEISNAKNWWVNGNDRVLCSVCFEAYMSKQGQKNQMLKNDEQGYFNVPWRINVDISSVFCSVCNKIRSIPQGFTMCIQCHNTKERKKTMEKPYLIELGDEVEDKVTGVRGYVICRVEWLFRPNTYGVQPLTENYHTIPPRLDLTEETLKIIGRGGYYKRNNLPIPGDNEVIVAQETIHSCEEGVNCDFNSSNHKEITLSEKKCNLHEIKPGIMPEKL